LGFHDSAVKLEMISALGEQHLPRRTQYHPSAAINHRSSSSSRNLLRHEMQNQESTRDETFMPWWRGTGRRGGWCRAVRR
jgi:hypothetical protein